MNLSKSADNHGGGRGGAGGVFGLRVTAHVLLRTDFILCGLICVLRLVEEAVGDSRQADGASGGPSRCIGMRARRRQGFLDRLLLPLVHEEDHGYREVIALPDRCGRHRL